MLYMLGRTLKGSREESERGGDIVGRGSWSLVDCAAIGVEDLPKKIISGSEILRLYSFESLEVWLQQNYFFLFILFNGEIALRFLRFLSASYVAGRGGGVRVRSRLA